MLLSELLEIIYNSKTAHYHIGIDGRWMILTYEQIYKQRLQNRPIRFIENLSPDEYCCNHWWISLRSENYTEDSEVYWGCEMETLERFDGSDPHYRCKVCGHENYEDYLPNFCPKCGKTVKHVN